MPRADRLACRPGIPLVHGTNSLWSHSDEPELARHDRPHDALRQWSLEGGPRRSHGEVAAHSVGRPMNRPRLVNRTSATPSTLLQRAIFDGYDFGLKIPYIAGSNRALLELSGFFISAGSIRCTATGGSPKASCCLNWTLCTTVSPSLLEAFTPSPGGSSAPWSNPRRPCLTDRPSPGDAAAHRAPGRGRRPTVRRVPSWCGGGGSADARVFLRPSSSWRIDTTPELLRSNLILELGPPRNNSRFWILSRSCSATAASRRRPSCPA